MPSHYVKQYWFIVNWIHRNKLKLNANQNRKIFFHENAFANVVCEMTTILSRGRWVKPKTKRRVTVKCLLLGIATNIWGRNSFVEFEWQGWSNHLQANGGLRITRNDYLIAPLFLSTQLGQVAWMSAIKLCGQSILHCQPGLSHPLLLARVIVDPHIGTSLHMIHGIATSKRRKLTRYSACRIWGKCFFRGVWIYQRNVSKQFCTRSTIVRMDV